MRAPILLLGLVASGLAGTNDCNVNSHCGSGEFCYSSNINKAGRIVSKKRSAMGKKNTWIVAVNKARAFLKIKGFAVVKKGTPLYKKAKEFMA